MNSNDRTLGIVKHGTPPFEMVDGEQRNRKRPKRAHVMKLPRAQEACFFEYQGLRYTARQLEHIGDAIIEMVGRIMVHERCGTNQRLYFNFASRMGGNVNLGGSRLGGSQIEEMVGRVYALKGYQAAIKEAVRWIERTPAWADLLRYPVKKI